MGAAGHTIVLRYHEIALKGRNRPFFVRRLVENVERATAGLPVGRVRRASARLLLPLADTVAWPAVRERLARVFGVVNFALAHEHALATRGGDAAAELVHLGEAIVAGLEGVALPSLRVRTKRSDKRFALTSPEVNAILGRMIQAATGAAVDLDAAALTVAVDILPGRAFFSLEKVPGAGGLPVGASGRVLALLSGGIDSPVAARRLRRRRCPCCGRWSAWTRARSPPRRRASGPSRPRSFPTRTAARSSRRATPRRARSGAGCSHSRRTSRWRRWWRRRWPRPNACAYAPPASTTKSARTAGRPRRAFSRSRSSCFKNWSSCIHSALSTATKRTPRFMRSGWAWAAMVGPTTASQCAHTAWSASRSASGRRPSAARSTSPRRVGRSTGGRRGDT